MAKRVLTVEAFVEAENARLAEDALVAFVTASAEKNLHGISFRIIANNEIAEENPA